MSRRQRSRRHEGEHPTYTAILEQAMAVLTEDGFDRFDAQRVLDGAGVSRATLYNHFADTLIEAVLIATFTRETDLYRARLATIVDDASDRAAFREVLRTLMNHFSHLPDTVRLRRAHTMVLSAARPQLATAIAELQDQISETWSQTIRDG
jgi:AcrR family transcriptional regulator